MITTEDLEKIMTVGVVHSKDGREIGTACEVYLDHMSGEPAMGGTRAAWLVVSSSATR